MPLYKPRLVYFIPHFSRAVDIKDNLYTKQGNEDLKSAVYNQERVKMAHRQYLSTQYTEGYEQQR